ncbi:MAG: hypothetical protein ACRC92_20485 [Peptostreptococcaceae bacterium]
MSNEIHKIDLHTEGVEGEKELLRCRDNYAITGNPGMNLPLRHLKHIKSPYGYANLDLEDVKILADTGFTLENKRTGDIVKERNVDKYITKWNKEGGKIL